MRGPDPQLPPLRDVIARYGLGARRRLGQHFLLDLNLTARIARSAGDLSGRSVIEVGPGPGGLTRALLASGARDVIAVELDERCIAALKELLAHYPNRLRLIHADALKIDVAALTRAPRKIVANLPYNVAAPLILSWLRRIDAFESLTLMVQKEMAIRLSASPGSRDYGRPSVIVQWLCEIRREFDVPPRAFTPPPKVTSTLITLRPRAAPLAPADFEALETVTAAAFGQRRKMLRASLRSLHINATGLLADADIRPEARAEELSVAEFCALARAWRATAPGAGV